MAKESREYYLTHLTGQTNTGLQESLATIASGKNPDGSDFVLDISGGSGGSGDASAANQTTLNTAFGAQADSAATTDAGTFSFIALLKRFLGKFPATIGAKAKASALAIAFATDQVGTAGTAAADVLSVQGIASMTPVTVAQQTFTTPHTGEFQGSTSAGVLPTQACSWLRMKARTDNVGSVYVGPSGVTRPDGATDTTSGWELAPGDETGWVMATNLNTFYRICDNAGDDLTYWTY